MKTPTMARVAYAPQATGKQSKEELLHFNQNKSRTLLSGHHLWYAK
ncbi:MAG: hypothetical protein KI791_04635 [Cyclobacteriaceae bacterium]|nr:hypothetical protein [Cyclobacteriaceae bacterium SS2]